jgi:hypothetical protein
MESTGFEPGYLRTEADPRSISYGMASCFTLFLVSVTKEDKE